MRENKFYMKACIFTECGDNIGLGHITRCMALYKMLLEYNVAVKFLINYKYNKSNLSIGEKWVNLNWLTESKKLHNYLNGTKIVIIDSYLAKIKNYNEISSRVETVIYLDDTNRLEYPKGIVVNGSIGAKSLNYKTRNEITYLLGVKYQILRKAFWAKSEKIIKSNINDILILFGGNDKKNIIIKTLETIKDKYKNVKRNIVVGIGYGNIDKLKKISDEKTEIFYNLNDNEMRNLMIKSDIAISGGGQTLYELAKIGVPTICIGNIENQKGNIIGLKSTGFLEFAGWWYEDNIYNNMLKILNKMNNKKMREKKFKIGTSLMIENGCKNILDYIIKKHI